MRSKKFDSKNNSRNTDRNGFKSGVRSGAQLREKRGEKQDDKGVLLLRNPHSVLAVLATRPEDVLEIRIPAKGATEGWERVAKLAKDKRIPVSTPAGPGAGAAPRSTGREGAGREADYSSTRMGFAEARVRERKPISIEELVQNASTREGGKGLWLALDTLQDTHNVGAIFRAAAFFGVQGIIITQDRSASLTATVYDVASGGMEHVPFVIQPNMQRAFEIVKEAGLWILGTSEHATESFKTIARDRPWLLVLGNEEKGMRRLTEETCDLLCTIPGKGEVTSLNVSVSAGILISHLASV